MLISDNIKEFDDIWAPTKVLKGFDLSLYLHRDHRQDFMTIPDM